jgi:hypothetical protein
VRPVDVTAAPERLVWLAYTPGTVPVREVLCTPTNVTLPQAL